MKTTASDLRRFCVFAVGCAVAVLGAHVGAAAEGIRGYYDPSTKSFTPLPPRVAKTAAPALTTVTGTFKISVSVKIGPKIPATVKLGAAVTISAQDPDTYNPALQYVINTGDYLQRDGNSGTLSLTIPYVYKLADPSAPVTFTLQVYETQGGTKFTPTSTGITTIKLPKDGSTTRVTLGETI